MSCGTLFVRQLIDYRNIKVIRRDSCLLTYPPTRISLYLPANDGTIESEDANSEQNNVIMSPLNSASYFLVRPLLCSGSRQKDDKNRLSVSPVCGFKSYSAVHESNTITGRETATKWTTKCFIIVSLGDEAYVVKFNYSRLNRKKGADIYINFFLTYESYLPYPFYLYKSTLTSKGLSKSFNKGCLVSFSDRIALSIGIFQSIPRESSRMLIPPSASG